jgi:hypothetical protein
MNDELYKMLKYLRLPGLLENFDPYLAMAGKQRFSHGRLLQHVVKEEYELRRRNAHNLRLKKSKIPERFVIETYPFERQPKLNYDARII